MTWNLGELCSVILYSRKLVTPVRQVDERRVADAAVDRLQRRRELPPGVVVADEQLAPLPVDDPFADDARAGAVDGDEAGAGRRVVDARPWRSRPGSSSSSAPGSSPGCARRRASLPCRSRGSRPLICERPRDERVHGLVGSIGSVVSLTTGQFLSAVEMRCVSVSIVGARRRRDPVAVGRCRGSRVRMQLGSAGTRRHLRLGRQTSGRWSAQSTDAQLRRIVLARSLVAAGVSDRRDGRLLLAARASEQRGGPDHPGQPREKRSFVLGSTTSGSWGLVVLPRAGAARRPRRRAAIRGRRSSAQQPLPFGQGQAVLLAQLQLGAAALAWQTQ